LRPQVVKSDTTDQIGLWLKYHPSEYVYEKAWNTESETEALVKIQVTNRRVQIPLLSLNTLEQFRVFLDRCGLKITVKDIDSVLAKAREQYGSYVSWLNCTRLTFSLHGLCGFNGLPQDSLLIQNSRECDNKTDGMFTVKRSLLNKYYESIGSQIRFIKSYTVRKPI